MKVLLRPPLFGKIWLVDWHGIRPLWERSWQHDEVKDEVLIKAFSKHWFSDKGSERRLVVGHIDFFPHETMVMFSNGTHRTRVLAQRLRFLPLAAHASTYGNKRLSPFFVRRIEKTEEFEVSDFPVLTPVGAEIGTADLIRHGAGMVGGDPWQLLAMMLTGVAG